MKEVSREEEKEGTRDKGRDLTNTENVKFQSHWIIWFNSGHQRKEEVELRDVGQKGKNLTERGGMNFQGFFTML